MGTPTILITTPTGNVGYETLKALRRLPQRPAIQVVAAVRDLTKKTDALDALVDTKVQFDFADPGTFETALAGISQVLLVRPPQLADVDLYFRPFVEAMRRAEVQQVVFLSLQGVENNTVTPHYKIEKLLMESGLAFTFLRPSFFMQNLSTTHRDEIASRDELYMPAGDGRTSFIDVVDIGEVAALTLTDLTGKYRNQAYELTGDEALTYREVATQLSYVLNRPIKYRNPSVLAFIWRKWIGEKMPLSFVLVMVALYTVAKLGKAAALTPVFREVTGHAPRTFRQFAEANRAVWEKR
ncbi:SDR family oxidoreductase [uncultured Fibrella sp.]|uniref:SDR family oxidoreductase n=1 Tax=uncultured Fibrella sp. TaxID=1284596 RepID=UPI0035CB8D4F